MLLASKERLALSLVLGCALARVLIRESVYDTSVAAPGAFAGVAVSNLFCLLPLVVAWRSGRALRVGAGVLLLGAIGVLAVLSSFWATSSFQAAIAGSNVLAAFCLAYATYTATNRSGDQSPAICSLMVGVVIALSLQSAFYLVVDRPALLEWWQENRTSELARMGMTSDVEGAFLVDDRVASRQLSGFFLSPNTLGTVAGMVGAMVVVAAWASGRRRSIPAMVLIPLLAAGLVFGAGARAAAGISIVFAVSLGLLLGGPHF